MKSHPEREDEREEAGEALVAAESFAGVRGGRRETAKLQTDGGVLGLN